MASSGQAAATAATAFRASCALPVAGLAAGRSSQAHPYYPLIDGWNIAHDHLFHRAWQGLAQLSGNANFRRRAMGILIWLLIGAVVGSLAGMIMRESFGLIGNIVVGIVGSAIGGMIFARGDINNSPLTVTTFAVSLLGAIVLLAVVNLLRRGSLT
jgi:uncharacterized membrane protein YeaQ/YmgE (transglycosylase-associated protein family)